MRHEMLKVHRPYRQRVTGRAVDPCWEIEWLRSISKLCDVSSCSVWAVLIGSILIGVGGLLFCLRYEPDIHYFLLRYQTWSRGFIRYHSVPFSIGNGYKELDVCSYQLNNSGSTTNGSTSASHSVSKGFSPASTTCAGSFQGHLTLTAKQACSVYSAAHHHPSRNVIFLVTCPLAPQFYKWTKAYVRALFDLPNFFFGYVDLEAFYANTSLLDFYRQDLVNSKYPTAHNSDLLRLYVLYLYGGTYLDLDVISLRSLDDLGDNFIGQESPYHQSVANGVMNFKPKHEFLRKCLFRGLMTYDATRWNIIGPQLITNSLQLFCNLTVTGKLERSEVCDITILPVNTFYAVNGNDWMQFYNASLWPKIEKMLNGSYVAHYWNHEGSFPLKIGSDQPIIKLAQNHCANVYKTCSHSME